MKRNILIWMFVFVVLITSVSAGIPDKLISYYSFDYDARDDYSNQDGTVDGATIINSGQKVGVGAYSFDGNNDYINFTSFTGELKSISFWYKANQTITTSSTWEPILNIPNGIGVITTGQFTAASELIYLQIDDGSGAGFYWGLTQLGFSEIDTDWHFYTFVWETSCPGAGGYQLYFDNVNHGCGALWGTPILKPYNLTSESMVLGAKDSSYMHSRIDELGFYHVKLRDENVSILYNSGNGFNPIIGANFSVTINSPINDTATNSPLNISYSLRDIINDTTCLFYNSGANFYNLTTNISDTLSLPFNDTYWQVGNNNILINCSDGISNQNASITIFLDISNPEIKYVNYTVSGVNAQLDNQTFNSTQKFNLSIQTEDDNNYLLNVTIYKTNNKVPVYSQQVTNANTTQNMSIQINPASYSEGWYEVNITGADAHTKQAINFNTELRERNIVDLTYKGKEFDEKVSTYAKTSEILSFNTIQEKDRKSFHLAFQSSITQFSMFVEGENEVLYMGDRYGYTGHFIIDNKYWYDLENEDGAKVKNIIKHSDTKYEVILTKPSSVNYVTFNSLGIINYNSEKRYFYIKNRLAGFDGFQDKFITYGENASIEYKDTSTNGTLSIELPRGVELYEGYLSIYLDKRVTGLEVWPNGKESRIIDINTPLDGFYSSGNFDLNFSANDIANCDCSGCVILANSNCSYPLNFNVNEPVNITFNHLYASYTFQNSTINITLRVAENKSLLTYTNITVQIVGSVFQAQDITDTGYANFKFPFNTTGSETVSIRAFDTTGTDYTIVIRELLVEQGLPYNLTMYLTNTSDVATTNLVTFKVQDQNRYSIDGAVISIQRQDPSTNTYLPITDLTTNTQGEATTILEVDTVFYKLIVTRNNQIIYTSPKPFTISLNDDIIEIVGVISDYNPYTDNYLGTLAQITFVNTSNVTGYFKMDYTGLQTVEACLYIEILNGTGRHYVEETCQNGLSGLIQSTDFAPQNRTFYHAIAYIDPNDTYGRRVADEDGRYIGDFLTLISSSENLLLLLLVVVVAAFGFVESPVVGIIILATGSLVVGFMGLTGAFGIAEAMILVVVCGIVIFSISKVRK